MTFLEPLRRIITPIREFTTHHTGEILWACLFALLFGWPLARMIDPPKPDLTLVVLADHSTPQQTIQAFQSAVDHQPLLVGSATVKLEVERLEDNNPATVLEKAKALVQRDDVLMVIAHLNSEAVETALPVFFAEANPKIPVITTVASDDDLLVKCGSGSTSACMDTTNFAPLLQLSPTNTQQATWAVAYATEQHKRKFMILYDDSSNASYARNLSSAYKAAVEDFDGRKPEARLVPFGPFNINDAAKNTDLNNVDCILYAGSVGNVKSTLERLKQSNPNVMVILSDSAVERTTQQEQDELGSAALKIINFTYQTDALDYNLQTNVFAADSMAIARELFGDLAIRGTSFRSRFKALFGLGTAMDARQDLVNTMKRNAEFRTSYEGAKEVGDFGELHPVYVFEYHKRVNGMFHVWELREGSGHIMNDVDHWHPERFVPTTQEQAQDSPPSKP